MPDEGIDHGLPHAGPRPVGGAADMGQEDGALALDQRLAMRFVLEHIESGPQDRAVIEGFDQCRFIDDIATEMLITILPAPAQDFGIDQTVGFMSRQLTTEVAPLCQLLQIEKKGGLFACGSGR